MFDEEGKCMMQEAFITREQFYAMYQLDQSLVFLMKKDVNGYQYVYTNQAAKDFFSDNLEGKYLTEIVNRVSVPLIEKNYEEAIANHNQVTYHDFYLENDRIQTNKTVCTPIKYNKDTYLLASTSKIEELKIGTSEGNASNTAAFNSLKISPSMMKHLFDTFNVAVNICITDTQGVIEYVNASFEQTTEYSASELIGNTNAMLNSRKQSRAFYKELWSQISSGFIWRGEMCNRTKYGRNYWLDTTIVPITDEQGEIKHYLGISFDVSNKKMQMTKLKNTEKLFQLITEHTKDFIVITSDEGIIQYVSPNHEAKLGYGKDELIGKFYMDLLSKDSAEKMQKELAQHGEFDSIKLELEICSKDRRTFWTEAQLTKVRDSKRKGIYQTVLVAREVTERKEMEEQLRYLAYHDALTKLPNRRYLIEKVTEYIRIADSSGSSLALLFIDGDNFKEINDTYGHEIGDEFIKSFGEALSSSVRNSDLVARIGGDEFIIVLTDLSIDEMKRKEQIGQTIRRIQDILHTGWMIGPHTFSPTSSIGVACYPEHGSTVAMLLDQADQALYYAKRVAGKDSYHYVESIQETRDSTLVR